MAKPLRLVSWNVNGLRAVHKKGFVDWFRKASPDVLCLQETKCQVDQVPEEILGLKDWTSEWNCAEKKGYSGTATFSKIKPKAVRKGFALKEWDTEGRVVETEFEGFTLFNIYFPNGKMGPHRLEYKMGFYDALLKIIAKRRKAGLDKIVICGDVNTAHKEIDLARPKENQRISGFLPQERAWIDKLLANGFVDTLRVFDEGPGRYTYWDNWFNSRERNVGWRIDYFFVSENLKPSLKHAFIWPEVLGSDHCPLGIDLAV